MTALDTYTAPSVYLETGSPVAPLPVRLRSYDRLDSPAAWVDAERGRLVPIHSDNRNDDGRKRFESYDYTIGVHGTWVPKVDDIPEYLVGSATHRQTKKFEWCRSDGAYYIAPRRQKGGRAGAVCNARGWSNPPFNQTDRKDGGVSVVLWVKPEGWVCIDRNLSEGEFLATRLKVLGVLSEAEYIYSKGTWMTGFWRRDSWRDSDSYNQFTTQGETQ